jgi:hypothetical protein
MLLEERNAAQLQSTMGGRRGLWHNFWCSCVGDKLS